MRIWLGEGDNTLSSVLDRHPNRHGLASTVQVLQPSVYRAFQMTGPVACVRVSLPPEPWKLASPARTWSTKRHSVGVSQCIGC